MRATHRVLTLAILLGVSATSRAIELDRTFGQGGIVTSFNRSMAALVLQPDGRIVTAGSDYENHVVLVRYTNNGVLDQSFGVGGVATSFAPFYPSAMALQHDGRIVVTGSTPGATGQVFFVCRFLTNGEPDPSFGTGGVATTDFPPNQNASVNAMAIQPDGKIVVAGGAGTFPSYHFAAARYDPDGSLDVSFGSAGRTIIDMGGAPEFVTGLVVERDGRMVLGGLTGSPSGSGCGFAGLLSDGAFDPSFGNGGQVFLSIGVATDCQALALAADGKLVAVGEVVPGGMLAVRLNPDGSLDPSFGTNGVAGLASFLPTAVALDVQGRIVVSGSGDDPPSGFAVGRLLANGQPDVSIGPKGWIGGPIGENPPHFQSSTVGVAVQPDGAIVLGGSQYIFSITELTIVRFAGAAATIPTLSWTGLLALATLLGLVGAFALVRPNS